MIPTWQKNQQQKGEFYGSHFDQGGQGKKQSYEEFNRNET
jgi:hypothetical protein